MSAAELAMPLAWLATLQLAAWGAGRRLLSAIQWTPGPEMPGAATHFLAATLGFIALAHLATGLAALGWLRAPALVGIALLLALAGLRDLLRDGALQRWARFRPVSADLPLGLAIGVLVWRIPAGLYPVLRHDDAAYHLALPKAYLAAGGFVEFPFSHYANMPHAVEVLYAFAFAGGGFLCAKLMSVGFAAWTFVGLAAFARPRLGRLGIGVGALLFAAAPNVAWHLGIAHIEIALGVFLLGAGLALTALVRSEGESRAAALVFAACCGASLAAKYTGWLFAAPLWLAAALVLMRSASPLRTRIGRVAGMSALVAASVAPWLVKNAIYTGNPIYPNLFGWLGGSNWSEAQALHLSRSMAFAGGEGGGFAAFLRLPYDLVFSPDAYFSEAFSGATTLLFLAALGALLARRVEDRDHRWTAAVGVGGLLAWGLGVQQGRFLVAWLPLIVVVALQAFERVGAPLRPWAAAAIALLGCAQLALQGPADGAKTRDVFRKSLDELVARNRHYAVSDYLNEVVPPGGKVLGLWENRLFFLDAPFHADTAWEAPQILSALRRRDDASAFAADLRSQGFTHGVITHTAEKYLRNARMFDLIHPEIYPEAQLDRDRDLVESLLNAHTETIFRSGDARVFRFVD